jgi:hypothetical protein
MKTNVFMLVSYFIQAARVFISGTVNICVATCRVVWLCAASSKSRALQSGYSLHEIRLYKTQVSVTQSASDWAPRAKSHSNIMVLIKPVLKDQMFALYFYVCSFNGNMFDEY